MKKPVLVVHGGAGKRHAHGRASELHAALERIAAAAWPVLEGGSALDAVVESVRLLEEDPLFNAGLGSKLQQDGVPRLCAAVMDGARERFGGVVNVVGLANPVLLARELVEEGSRTLAGVGAEARARQVGLAFRDNETEAARAEWTRRKEGLTGTVGAVALDAQGRLAAATSTGGRGYERPHRVSDTPTVAANFASEAGAVSCTGVGEEIVEGALAVRLVQAIEDGRTVHEACERVLARMRGRGWRAGFVVLDAEGSWAAHTTTDALYWWAVDAEGSRGFDLESFATQ